MIKKNLSFALFGSLLSLSGIAQVQAQPTTHLESAKTLTLCVDYSDLTDSIQKTAYMKELDRRGQLSVEDHENFAKDQVINGSTMCGMYMTLGKPISETSKQIRPMVFKTVHVYNDTYYVTQSGIVVNAYPRKEGVMPPKLSEPTPETQAPPAMFNAPGGQPNHH